MTPVERTCARYGRATGDSPPEPGNLSGRVEFLEPGLLLECIEKKKVCKATHLGLGSRKEKTFRIKPLKIFSHNETVYVHGKLAMTPGQRTGGALLRFGATGSSGV